MNRDRSVTIKASHFRDLSPEELYGILRLRSEVFIIEQGIVCQDMDGVDRDSWQVWAEEDGEILGCLRVFKDDSPAAKIGRVATSLRIRGKGWGLKMMEAGIRTAREHFGNIPVLIHSQAYATGFYEKLGFRISSEQFIEECIPHFEMVLPADRI